MNASTHHWYATIGFSGEHAGIDKETPAVESRRMATTDAESLAVLTDSERVALAEDGVTHVEEGTSVLRLVSCSCNKHLVRVAGSLDEDPSIIIRRRLLGVASVRSPRSSGVHTLRPESSH